MHRTRSGGRESVAVRVGRHAHRPVAAAVAIAVVAAAFSASWFQFYAGGFGEPPLRVLFLATVTNAAGVAALCWAVFAPEAPWSYRRGAGLGLLVAAISHLTIGVVWTAVLYADLVGTWNVGSLLGVGLYLSFWSLFLTFGFPTLLSLAVALGLTYCRQRAGAALGRVGDSATERK